MGEKLPPQAADEGRAGRKIPLAGWQRQGRPSSGFASLSHLLPFWRYAPPPPYRGSLSPRGTAGEVPDDTGASADANGHGAVKTAPYKAPVYGRP